MYAVMSAKMGLLHEHHERAHEIHRQYSMNGDPILVCLCV